MLELIERLTGTFGPAGSEGKIRALLCEEAEKLKHNYFVDTLGNLVVTAGGKSGKKILTAAHMDEIGLMVTFIEENGFLRFTNIGGILKNTLLGTRVVFENEIVGVIGQEKIKDAKNFSLDKLYIDIGAKDRNEAQEMLRIGSPAVFYTPFNRLGDRIVAKSLDNRIGCAVLLEVLKRLPSSLPNEVYFVFTVQEEVGLRGARTVSYRLEPDYGLAVDVTRVGDTPEPDYKMEVSLGKGPAVKIKDSSVICHQQVIQLIIETAETNNIPYQLEVLEKGGTDAGAIHLSKEGIPSGAISIPCRYVHSPGEMVDLHDVENSVSLMLELLKKNW